jgi:hypothetical protein
MRTKETLSWTRGNKRSCGSAPGTVREKDKIYFVMGESTTREITDSASR